MKKSKVLVFNSLLLSVLVVSCAGGNNTTTSTTPATTTTGSSVTSTEVVKYQDKTVNVNYVKSEKNQQTTLRFFEETEDIPYLEMNTYYKLLLKNTPLADISLSISNKDSMYTITTPRGGKATYDAKENIFESPDFTLFNCTNYFDSTVTGVQPYDGAPWLRVKEVSHDKEAMPFKVDFDKYSIKVFDVDNKLYFPVQTLSDLFNNMNLLGMSYNQKDLYVINKTENDSVDSYENYYKPLIQKTLSAKYAKFNYDEYCFTYDHLLGRPNRSSLSKYYDLTEGLDKALEKREFGRQLKALYTSTDPAAYAIATVLLGRILGDGGHTTFQQSNYYMSGLALEYGESSEQMAEFYSRANSLLDPIRNKTYEEVMYAETGHSDQRVVRNLRAEILNKDGNLSKLQGDVSYTAFESGKTAMISVDDFMGEVSNIDLWNEYYNGTRDTIPYNIEGTRVCGGAVSNIYKGILKAKQDNVENIIIDLASNTGGSTDELIYFIAALTGNKTFKTYDYTTGRKTTTTYEVDINLDKKFDENDVALTEGLTVSALISQNGFSCGGISPVYLHDLGVFTFGDYSGGGSCAIYYNYDAYGLPFVNSCPFQVLAPKGGDIDSVRTFACDVRLGIQYDEAGRETGEVDYREFYNQTNLEALINQHFNKTV